MIGSNEGSLVIMPPAAIVSAATQRMSFDRSVFDYANIDVMAGAHNTQTAVITGITLAESDTVTSASSMTAIGSISVSNTTAATAINAIPGIATVGLGGIITSFQLDLRKRKKYIGVSVHVHATNTYTAVVGAIARLTRSSESKDSAAQKSLPLNLADTAAVSCMQIAVA